MKDHSSNSGASVSFKGTVGSPELGPFAGTAIAVHHRLLRVAAETGFCSLDLHQTDGMILALDWIRGETHHVWGSAVMVAPGVALTARHTIDGMRDNGFLADDGGYLMAYGFHIEGMMMWNAVHLEQDPSGDLAVLTLVRATAKPDWPLDRPLPVNAATIAARMPRRGEKVFLVGFRASEDEFVGSGSAAELGVGLYGSAGPVLEVFEAGRSEHNRKPGAHIVAETVNGMSGGAAFDSDGRLIGIISKGVNDISYVLFTWPILFTEFEVAWPLGLSASPTCLHAMAGAGLASIEGIKNLIPGRDANGTLTVTLVQPA